VKRLIPYLYGLAALFLILGTVILFNAYGSQLHRDFFH